MEELFILSMLEGPALKFVAASHSTDDPSHDPPFQQSLVSILGIYI